VIKRGDVYVREEVRWPAKKNLLRDCNAEVIKAGDALVG